MQLDVQHFLCFCTGDESVPNGVFEEGLQHHGGQLYVGEPVLECLGGVDGKIEVLVEAQGFEGDVLLGQFQLLLQGHTLLFAGLQKFAHKFTQGGEVFDGFALLSLLDEVFDGVEAVEQKVGIHLQAGGQDFGLPEVALKLLLYLLVAMGFAGKADVFLQVEVAQDEHHNGGTGQQNEQEGYVEVAFPFEALLLGTEGGFPGFLLGTQQHNFIFFLLKVVLHLQALHDRLLLQYIETVFIGFRYFVVVQGPDEVVLLFEQAGEPFGGAGNQGFVLALLCQLQGLTVVLFGPSDLVQRLGSLPQVLQQVRHLKSVVFRFKALEGLKIVVACPVVSAFGSGIVSKRSEERRVGKECRSGGGPEQ